MRRVPARQLRGSPRAIRASRCADPIQRHAVEQRIDPARDNALADQHGSPAVAGECFLLVEWKPSALAKLRQRVFERRRQVGTQKRRARMDRRVVARRHNGADEVADAVRFGVRLAIVIPQLDRRCSPCPASSRRDGRSRCARGGGWSIRAARSPPRNRRSRRSCGATARSNAARPDLDPLAAAPAWRRRPRSRQMAR